MSSIDVNVFRPVVETVRENDGTGTIVVKVIPANGDGETETHGSELTLFFMHTADGGTPEAHVAAFIASIVKGAGFDYFEYDSEGVSVNTPTVVVEHEKFAGLPIPDLVVPSGSITS